MATNLSEKLLEIPKITYSYGEFSNIPLALDVNYIVFCSHQDASSVQECMFELGRQQAGLVAGLVPQLLLAHPYFDAVEPSLHRPHYICKVIDSYIVFHLMNSSYG